MIRAYFIRLLAKSILIFGSRYNGVQHKFYAFLLSRIIKYRKSTIYSNLVKSFPSYSLLQIEAIAKAYYHRLAYYIIQSIYTYFGKEEEISQKLVVKNAAILQKCLDDNQNVILLSAHYGNWELISTVMPKHFTNPVIGVYKPLSSIAMEAEVKKWRSRFGLVMVPMKEMISWFSPKNKTPFICLLISDQSPPINESGEILPFLHQNTMFYNGANVLKKRYHPKIFYQKTIVIKDIHYIEFIELLEQNVTQQYASLLESDIHLDPTLWLWSHNRWKHQI